MKTLYLMRHAKSSWKDGPIEDFDRPLNKRGERDAPFMGKLMNQTGILPQEMISSPAKRALSTASLFCSEIKFPHHKLKVDNNLYAASSKEMLSVIENLSENVESVLIIAHNPGLTDLANYLSDFPIDNIPTCGIVELLFNKKSWKEIEFGSCRMGFFEYPKKHFES
jgi:phosphohistidine phosphatase